MKEQVKEQPPPAIASDLLNPWLMFTIDQETYGVWVRYVQEVLECTAISAVPGAPSHLFGIFSLRGKMIALTDIRITLGLPRGKVTASACVVLLELEGQSQGILVDAVIGIVEIQESEIEKTVIGDRDKGYIEGTYQKEGTLYILLSELSCWMMMFPFDLGLGLRDAARF